MRILVTGGTGFVGSHSVAALLAAGHEVRLLARSPERVPGTLAEVGADAGGVDVVRGDVLDAASVARALEGVEAVLHAASVFTYDIRRSGEVRRANDVGTRNVLQASVERGLDPVVHVSSLAALYRRDATTQRFHEQAPSGDSPFLYTGSKAEQERTARRLQDDGAPLVTTYPGAVFGPHDPYDGESSQLVRNLARGRGRLSPGGDVAAVDVRDVAALHARLFKPDLGPRRFLIGQVLPIAALTRMTLELVDRSTQVVTLPNRVVRTTGRLCDWLQPRIRARLPISYEEAWYAVSRVEMDMSGTTALGVTCRPIKTTLADQIAWQRAAGRL
jgi:dihydroflavonol-4-reductase